MRYAARALDVINGNAVTDFLAKLLSESGCPFTSTATEREMIQDVKEKLGYVATDFESEMKRTMEDNSLVEEKYETPAGDFISIGKERFR